MSAVEGNYELRHFTEVGKPLPLSVGASGKLLLAFADPATQAQELRRVAREPLTPRAPDRRGARPPSSTQIRATGLGTLVRGARGGPGRSRRPDPEPCRRGHRRPLHLGPDRTPDGRAPRRAAPAAHGRGRSRSAPRRAGLRHRRSPRPRLGRDQPRCSSALISAARRLQRLAHLLEPRPPRAASWARRCRGRPRPGRVSRRRRSPPRRHPPRARPSRSPSAPPESRSSCSASRGPGAFGSRSRSSAARAAARARWTSSSANASRSLPAAPTRSGSGRPSWMNGRSSCRPSTAAMQIRVSCSRT